MQISWPEVNSLATCFLLLLWLSARRAAMYAPACVQNAHTPCVFVSSLCTSVSCDTADSHQKLNTVTTAMTTQI